MGWHGRDYFQTIKAAPPTCLLIHGMDSSTLRVPEKTAKRPHPLLPFFFQGRVGWRPERRVAENAPISMEPPRHPSFSHVAATRWRVRSVTANVSRACSLSFSGSACVMWSTKKEQAQVELAPPVRLHDVRGPIPSAIPSWPGPVHSLCVIWVEKSAPSRGAGELKKSKRTREVALQNLWCACSIFVCGEAYRLTCGSFGRVSRSPAREESRR
jgi:hypothetical protein